MFSTKQKAKVRAQVYLLKAKDFFFFFYIVGFKDISCTRAIHLNNISQFLGKEVISLVFIFLDTFV